MGYTHYWNYDPENFFGVGKDPGKVVPLIVEAAREIVKIAQSQGIQIEGRNGDSDDCLVGLRNLVFLNGIAEKGHETFVFPGDTGFNFCKTARKPYDVIVIAILAIAEYYAPTVFKIDSDGCSGDWVPGLKLAKEATGFEIPAPKCFCSS